MIEFSLSRPDAPIPPPLFPLLAAPFLRLYSKPLSNLLLTQSAGLYAGAQIKKILLPSFKGVSLKIHWMALALFAQSALFALLPRFALAATLIAAIAFGILADSMERKQNTKIVQSAIVFGYVPH